MSSVLLPKASDLGAEVANVRRIRYKCTMGSERFTGFNVDLFSCLLSISLCHMKQTIRSNPNSASIITSDCRCKWQRII